MARGHPCVAMRCLPARMRLLPWFFCLPAPDLGDPSCAAPLCLLANLCTLESSRCRLLLGAAVLRWQRLLTMAAPTRLPATSPTPSSTPLRPGRRGDGADRRLASQRRHPQSPPPPSVAHTPQRAAVMPAMHRAAATKDAPLACGGTGTVAAPPRRCRAWRRCRRGIHQPDAAALVGAPAGGEKNKKKKNSGQPHGPP